MLEYSCNCSSVPAEASYRSNLKFVSFHSLCCLVNRKAKSLKKQCFYRNNTNVLRYQKFQHMFECCLSALTQTHNRFVTRSLPCSADDTLFELRSQRRNPLFTCVGVVVMETVQLVLSKFKNFL